MYGGLKKSASRLALVAAAGVLSTGAYAADLGGDCCADLEERVAELEATTARKGNRKVSLTVSGQVNRAIMYWNDGVRSNTYFGLDNTNSSTRFGFSGSAKISPAVSAGFSILIDVADKARTYTASQGAEDAGAANNGDHLLRMRDANWWLEHSALGRVTVGRLTTAGAVAGIDLAGVQVVASSSPGLVGGGLVFRNAAGALSSTGTSATAPTQITLNAMTDGGAYPTTRGEGIRWNSPTFAGFTVGASIAEAASIQNELVTATTGIQTGRNLGVDLRYAGEFSGVRIAAGIGYEKFEGNGDGLLNVVSAADIAATGQVNTVTQWGGSLALMHVPTGLFIQGDYLNHTAEGGPSTDATKGLVNFAGDREATRWIVQGGIAQNFFGIGRTSLYGEYGRAENWLHVRGINFGNGGGTLAGDNVRWWGLGVVQAIDAAAMDLYLGYRNFSAEDAIGGQAQDIDVITGGARIRF